MSRMLTAPGSNESVRSTPKKSIPLATIFNVSVPVGGNVTGDGANVIVELVCRWACGCVLGGAVGAPVGGGVAAGGCPAAGCGAGGAPGTGMPRAGDGPMAGTSGLARSRGMVSDPV